MKSIKNINNIFNIETKTPEELANIVTRKCTHYDNNVQIYASCCNKYFDCHICHNEETKHHVYLKKVDKIKCIKCNTENGITNKCKNCSIQFGKSHCNICNIWCNKLNNIFHCHECGTCRAGKREDYFHCKNCDGCLSINMKDNHVCKKINEKVDCPICLCNINYVDDTIILLKCKHLIHEKCLNEQIQRTDRKKRIPCCVLCKKSVVDYKSYEHIFDRNIENTEMPLFYQKWKTNILCNDCNVKSKVKYHFDHHKCNDCKSYNTTILDVDKNK